MIISSDLYRRIARESSRQISTTGILLPATELPAAGCHVCAAATQPRGDPDSQCSISSPSTMTPSREERVEQVMPVRDSLLEANPVPIRTRLSCRLRAIFAIRMLTVYVAYCQRDSSYDFSLTEKVTWDRPWKIVHRSRGNWFCSSSHRCPADKSWSNIRICKGHRVSVRIFAASYRLLRYRK